MVSVHSKMSLATLLSQNDVPSARHKVSIEALVQPPKGSLAYIVHDWPSATSLNRRVATTASTSKSNVEVMEYRQQLATSKEVAAHHQAPTGDPGDNSQAMKDMIPAQRRAGTGQTKKRKREEKDDDEVPSKRHASSHWHMGHEPMYNQVPEDRDTTEKGDKTVSDEESIVVTTTIDATSRRPRLTQESEVLLRRSARIKTLRARKTQDNGVVKRAR